MHRVSSILTLGISHSREALSPSPIQPVISADKDKKDVGNEPFSQREPCTQPDGSWHNPSLMQMVETLQVAMISKRDALAPLPVMYNSYILALVEGFAKLHEKLEACEMDLKELKFQREKDLEQFGAMSEEWMQRDDSYKKEIKRLELLLAKESKDGMASVVLARSDTLVDRSGSTHFQSRLKRLSSSHDGCELAPRVPLLISRTRS